MEPADAAKQDAFGCPMLAGSSFIDCADPIVPDRFCALSATFAVQQYFGGICFRLWSGYKEY